MVTTRHQKRMTLLGLGLSAALFALPVFADSIDEAGVFAKAKLLVAQVTEVVGPLYSYDLELDIDGVQATGTVHLAAASGQRLVVHSPPSEQWSEEFAEEISEYEENVGDDLWCQGLIEDVDDYSEVTTGDAGLIFKVRMKIDPDDKEGTKFARNMDIKVTLSADDGAVLGYSMRAPKPFRPVLVAKIKRFELDIVCERAPNGRTYAKSMRTDIEGRAMMQNFSQQESRSISNVRLP